MSEAPVEIPTSWWERVRGDRRKLSVVLGTGALALVLLGVLVAGVLGRGEGGAPDVADLGLPPIDGGSVEASAATGATGTADPPRTDDAPGPAGGPESGPERPEDRPDAVTRAPYIAYRLGGRIVVARDDGSAPVEVAESSEGVFALSPDGTLLALLEAGGLSVVNVADTTRRALGPAVSLGVAWQPDSLAVYVTRMSGEAGSSEVWRVPVDGGEPSRLIAGGPAAVASDGTVAVPPAPAVAGGGVTAALRVITNGSDVREIAVRGPVFECAVDEGLIVYAVHGDAPSGTEGAARSAEPEIRAVQYSGAGDRLVTGPPASQRPVGYGSLILSPDGSHLLFAEVGDDGYSRAFVVPTTAGGTARALTVRRDTYPFGWSADGSRVLFVEGNAFQGEPTALLTAAIDGTGRSVLVEGAGF